jgi:hypothetical protein
MDRDFALAPSALKNVRIAATLLKRSSAFPRAWRSRYVVLSANFVFI